MKPGAIDPLDALRPHEPELAAAQLSWLMSHMKPGHRVLDLGCGGGRTLVPLVAAGASGTGIDRDEECLSLCQQALDQADCSAHLVKADLLTWLAGTRDTWDLVCCLGNTFCLVWQVEEAVALLRAIREHLAPGGVLVLDDIPGDLWQEVAQGSWQEGIDPDSGRQLVWARDDAVFALREPDRADPGDWVLRPGTEAEPGDVPMRLWTAGALHLAAGAAGFSGPLVPAGSGVRVLTPAP